ncbi:MAG: Spi family protease inhibitor [Algoriphagus aquaeductus]|uniref:Spi family protease inhibitor n=1 Tax=Algoriphagus aquaeductus TaxID=475299 RepID=UPI003879304E
MKLIPFHRKVNLIFGFLLLIITSCQEYEPNPEQLDIQENDLNYVDISQAELIASTIEFPTVQSKSTSQKSNREEFDVKILGSKTISESKSSIGKNNKAVFHLINYEEGGFVILSADKRLPPILAFSLDNPMPFLSEKEYPEGLSDWFSNQ